MHHQVDRRTVLRRMALGLAGASLANSGMGGDVAWARAPRRGPDYGPLEAAIDETTGLPLLRLPRGFRYRSFGWTGDPLDDGTPTPARHDGMAVVRSRGGRVWLTRNHELGGRGASFGAPEVTFDPRGTGGTTTILFDTRRGEVQEAWASLAGTSVNCAGGPTPWGTWLSCEETTAELDEPHGWVFEVPGLRGTDAQPIKRMGRFRHEAAAVDPATSIVYLTEDQIVSGLYRFVPAIKRRLAFGGHLQMLAIDGTPMANLSGAGVEGRPMPVTWVDIDDPERADVPGTTNGLGVYAQGLDAGGATFRRLEGAWFTRRRLVFVSTSGGAAGEGQVWEYDPRRETLTLRFESRSADEANNPDNVALSRRGMVLCEDGSGLGQRLLGLGRAGRTFPLAENAVVLDGERNGIRGDFRGSEWAGACFHRQWLFANIQSPGVTFAITGPWGQGPL